MKKFGFTLAEVLITLGIIGVVAAMTMPTLLNSTQGAQYRTAYKKALSVLSQAVVLNIALDDYDLSQTTGTTTDGTTASVYNLFKNRMNVVASSADGSNEGWKSDIDNVITFGKEASSNYTLFFNDGIVFSFPQNSANCSESAKCKGVIDVNGAKNPNKVVTCDNQANSAYNEAKSDCTVTNPTDIYPVVMYDQTILPSTDAARAVLYGGK